MEITIAIVCSTDHLIKKCLESIPKNKKIMVLLNNPDFFVENVVCNDSRITVYKFDECNLGFLRQFAAENCKTEGILYLDSDCLINDYVIRSVENKLNSYYAVSIPLRYSYNNKETKIVSKCRLFTTPDQKLFIPAAFRLDIQERIGGYLYNKNLFWGEDTDQCDRIGKAGIDFDISDGAVIHKSLTIKNDIVSSKNLGKGTYIREKYGVSKKHNFWKWILPFKDIKLSYSCAREQGIGAGLYHYFIWRKSYKYGYWREYFNDKRNKN